MSAETRGFHHGKLHRAYVDKVNGVLAEEKPGGSFLVEIVGSARQNDDSSLFDNSAQIWNHNFFWQCLAPGE
jgi:Fe-Mn family superoxide dismutase